MEVGKHDLRQVETTARRLHKGRNWLDLDQMISDGMLGLAKAAKSYRPDYEVSWERHRNRQILSHVIASLRSQGGCNFQRVGPLRSMVSLDQNVGDLTRHEVIAAAEEASHLILVEDLAGLSQREREIVFRVVLQGEPQVDLAAEFGVSEGRISQIKKLSLKKLGVEPRLGVADSRQSLTQRERQVMQLTAEGHTNKEIGVTLCVTEETVKSHKRTVYKKLNAKGMAHAVWLAVQSGDLQLPAPH